MKGNAVMFYCENDIQVHVYKQYENIAQYVYPKIHVSPLPNAKTLEFEFVHLLADLCTKYTIIRYSIVCTRK